MIRQITVGLLCGWLAVLPVAATTRTVGTGGAAPNYSTVAAALAAMSASDTISIVEAKVYSENGLTLPVSGSSGNPCILRNDSGGTVTLKTTSTSVDSYGLNISTRQWWEISDITVEHAGAANQARCVGSSSTSAGHITLTRVVAVGSGGLLNGNNCHGFYFIGADNVTLDTCTSNVTSSSANLGWDGGDFLQMDTLLIVDSIVRADDPTKRDDGWVVGGTGITILRGEVKSGQSGDFVSFHPDGIVVQGQETGTDTSNVLIDRVLVRDFDQNIYLDPIHANLDDITIRNCKLLQTAEWVHAGTVKGIVVEGENNGGVATYKVDLQFYNNTIDVRGPVYRNLRQISTSGNNQKVIKGNLVINPASAAMEFGTGNNILNVTLDYNFYDSAGSSTPFNWSGGNRNLSTMQVTYLQEANGQRNTPGIVGGGDYAPSSGSSNIVAMSENLSAIFTDDYTGATRVAAPTLWTAGAYEWNTVQAAIDINVTTLTVGTLTIGP